MLSSLHWKGTRDGRGTEIVIIGGIIGFTLAYDLTRQSAQVTLLERQALAQKASWASAGIISAPSPAYFDLPYTSMLAAKGEADDCC